jgi:tetratricopeptide (TPR) repeat protein
VIGNDSYPGNALQNARNDARSVSDALSKVGYVSTLVLDADRATLAGKVDEFVETLHTGDTAILYYAGHGLQVDGENYLVPVDFHLASPTDAKEQGYSLSSILERLTSHGATTQIVILDACRDNPFLGTRSTRGGWAGLGTSAGAFLAFGTSPGSTASDAPGQGHGLFTKDLLRYLTTSNLDIEEMLRQVREDVIRDSDGKQVPWIASSLIGSYHILPQFDKKQRPLPTINDGFTAGQLSPDGRSLKPSVSERDASESSSPASASETAALAQASSLVRGAKFDMAIKVLRDILEINPECAVAIRLLGLVYHLTGRDAEAISTIDRALQLNKTDVRAAEYKCALEGVSGVPSAISDCENIVRENPSAESYLALAGTERAQGDDTRAYVSVSRSLGLAGSDLAYALRGSIAQQQGNAAGAQHDFSRAVQAAVAAH